MEPDIAQTSEAVALGPVAHRHIFGSPVRSLPFVALSLLAARRFVGFDLDFVLNQTFYENLIGK